jgi:hypothetical protein
MSGFDLSAFIEPKSDQLDACDLLSGPRTFLIERVTKGDEEQPVNIHLADFPRPWRPGKSMRRVLVAAWGKDASAYVGRRVTLFCDPDVRFGGQAVGGTRIAALSHIDKPKQVPLLVSRGKSAIFTVQPLADDAPAAKPVKAETGHGDAQLKALDAGLISLGITDRDTKLATVAQVIDREVKSAGELTAAERERVLDWITFEQQRDSQAELPEASA